MRQPAMHRMPRLGQPSSAGCISAQTTFHRSRRPDRAVGNCSHELRESPRAACSRSPESAPKTGLAIKHMVCSLGSGGATLMDLCTSYLGLPLAHPFVAGASPLGYHLDTIRRVEDAGAAAIVLHSLFEEQVTLATEGRLRHRDPFDREFADALADFPAASDYCMGPDAYAEHVRRAKEAVAIPVIASLNGTSAELWLTFARMIEQAGADALEVNLYEVVTDLSMPGA